MTSSFEMYVNIENTRSEMCYSTENKVLKKSTSEADELVTMNGPTILFLFAWVKSSFSTQNWYCVSFSLHDCLPSKMPENDKR